MEDVCDNEKNKLKMAASRSFWILFLQILSWAILVWDQTDRQGIYFIGTKKSCHENERDIFTCIYKRVNFGYLKSYHSAGAYMVSHEWMKWKLL